MLPKLAAGILALLLGDPAGQQAERVVPEGVDLDGLATPWRHHPVVDLGIHPGELIPLGALTEQTISRIDADAEARPTQVMLDDVAQDREQKLERRTVVGREQVAVERMEEPEGRIGRVIEAVLLTFREHIRDQAVADVASKHPEDVAGLGRPTGRQRQPFETDHRVAAPVREPGVAGDDGVDLIAGSVGPREIFHTAGRADDELVGGQHQLAGEAGARAWRGGPEQTPTTLTLGAISLVRAERHDRLPRLGRGDECHLVVKLRRDSKRTWLPQAWPSAPQVRRRSGPGNLVMSTKAGRAGRR